MNLSDGLYSLRGLGAGGGLGLGNAAGVLVCCVVGASGRFISRRRWDRRGPCAAYRLSSIGNGGSGSS